MKTRLLIPVIIFGIVIAGAIFAFFMFLSMPSDTWKDWRTGLTGVAPPDEINEKIDCLSRGGVWEHISCSIEEIPSDTEQKTTKLAGSNVECYGNARCFSGKVIKIIDGDTIKVVGESTTTTGESIRLALASAPEIDDGEIPARDYIAKICPVGSIAIIDEDDMQTEGSYGRVIAQIHCNGVNLNESILEAGLGVISSEFCSKSEFSFESWAIKFGCN